MAVPRLKAFVRCLFWLGSWFLSLSADAQGYSVTDLGVSGPYPTANAISASGQVVGGSGGFPLAYSWEDGVSTRLFAPSGYTNSVAYAVSQEGVVVGQSSRQAGTGSRDQATLWSNGVPMGLGWLPGDGPDGKSTAYGINNQGQVVGASSPAADALPARPSYEAFLWQNGVMTGLGFLPGHSISFARSINDSGQVVGDSLDPFGLDPFHGFLWQNGVMTDLGSGTAQDINEAGQVAGQVAGHAALWQNGIWTDLGALPGVEYSYALTLNDAGQVAGYFSQGGLEHAFLWQNGVMTDLNALIPAGSGWVLQQALGINDAGEMVGYGTFNGETRAFLLTPVPEPRTAVLLGIGFWVFTAVALTRNRRGLWRRDEVTPKDRR